MLLKWCQNSCKPHSEATRCCSQTETLDLPSLWNIHFVHCVTDLWCLHKLCSSQQQSNQNDGSNTNMWKSLSVPTGIALEPRLNNTCVTFESVTFPAHDGYRKRKSRECFPAFFVVVSRWKKDALWQKVGRRKR